MSPIVSASWLRDNLDKVVLFDAGYHLPTVKRDPVAEFDAAHIPGALRFDINIIADQSNPLPHMLPSADDFTTAMRALGVNSDSHVVFYDDSAIKPAARGWWMMRMFGHDTVSVLDGGLAAWCAIDGPLESGATIARQQGNFVPRPSTGAGVVDFTALVGVWAKVQWDNCWMRVPQTVLPAPRRNHAPDCAPDIYRVPETCPLTGFLMLTAPFCRWTCCNSILPMPALIPASLSLPAAVPASQPACWRWA